MNEYSTDPKHWTNRYTWNRKNATRRNLDAFLALASNRVEHGEAPIPKDQAAAMLAFLRALMDRTPQELFPNKTTTTKGPTP